MSRWPQPALLVGRDLDVEVAGREGLTTIPAFVAAMVVLAGLGFGPGPEVLRATAAGVVWLVLLVTVVPLAQVLLAAERREDSWDLLRGLLSPTRLLLGKLSAAWLWLCVVWLVAGLLSAALLGGLSLSVPLVAGGLLGTFGLATVTVGYGVFLSSGVSRSGLLAVLALPAGLPVLLAGVQTSRPAAPNAWLGVLLVYDLVSVTACWAVFPVLVEE